MHSATIKKMGLDPTEAKVYLALLELGPSTVSEITRQAAITRTLGYHVLDKLGWYGLVDRVSGQGSKMVYTAQHPSRLLTYVKGKKAQWERKVSETESLLPELISIFKLTDKPTVRYQEGVAGVISIYNETLQSQTEILSIMDIDSWDVPEFRKFGKEYNRRRSELKITERVLQLDTPAARSWMRDYRGSFRFTDNRWIKPRQLPGIAEFGGEINIFDNKVMIAIAKKPNRIGIMIESRPLANILRAMFELAWTQGVKAR